MFPRDFGGALSARADSASGLLERHAAGADDAKNLRAGAGVLPYARLGFDCDRAVSALERA